MAEEETGDTHYQSPLAEEMDRWLAEKMAAGEVKGADMVLMLLTLFVRLRAVLTVEELQSWTIQMAMTAEMRLQEGRAFHDEDGNSVNMLTAEERKELGVEALDLPDGVPEEWL